MPVIKPRRDTVTIYDGDDWDALSDLRRIAERADLMASTPDKSVLAVDIVDPAAAWEDYAQAAEEAAERGLTVTLEDIGSGRWRDLVAEHAPREGNRLDKQFGYNVDTFPRALLAFRDERRRTIVEPEMGAGELDDFLRDISDDDFDALYQKAASLNRGRVADPKDVRSLNGRPSSDAT